MESARKNGLSLTLLFIAAFGLSTCASSGLDKGAATTISRVALIGPQEPHYTITSQGSESLGVGAGLVLGGVVGGLIVAGATGAVAAPPPEITDVMQSVNLHLGEEIRSAIAQSLRKDGYEVVESVVPHEHDGAALLSKYDNVGTNSDAILDVAIGAGYQDLDHLVEVYTPQVLVAVRLVDTRTQKVLMSKQYPYSRMSFVRPEERYQFRSTQEIKSNAEFAAQGLRAAVPILADRIERDFAKR